MNQGPPPILEPAHFIHDAVSRKIYRILGPWPDIADAWVIAEASDRLDLDPTKIYVWRGDRIRMHCFAGSGRDHTRETR